MDDVDGFPPLSRGEPDVHAGMVGADGPLREVFVGIDGSMQSIAAARWAAAEAVARDARLHLMTVVARWANELPECGEHAEVGIRARKEADQGLAEARTAVRKDHPGLLVVCERRSGDPESALVDAAMAADLLVVGAHGSGSFADLVLGSVAAVVAARSECPVVVHRPRPEPTHRIVVGVELPAGERPLRSDSAAVRFAVAEARSSGSRLQLSTVDGGHDSVEALVEASKQADLLVLGRGPLHRGRLPVNSVAYGVLYHAASPVAIVPEPAAASHDDAAPLATSRLRR